MLLVLHPWELIRASLATLDEVLEPRDMKQAVEWSVRFSPTVAIVEPTCYSGAVSTLSPLVPVLVLTCDTRELSLLSAIASGASCYLHVSATVEAVETAIESIESGTPTLDTKDVRDAIRVLSRVESERLEAATPLTPQELNTLKLLARGYTDAEIADKLTISRQVVRNYNSTIFQKLGVRNRVEAVLRVARCGMEFVE